MDKDRFPTLSEPEDDSLDSILKRSNPKPFSFRSIIPEYTLFDKKEESEEDEDDEETLKNSKKQKKFTQLLKTVFPKTIEEGARQTETNVVEKINDHDEIFSDINTPEAFSEAAGVNTLADIPEVQPEPLIDTEPVVQEIELNQKIQRFPIQETLASTQEEVDQLIPVELQQQSIDRYGDVIPPIYAPPIFSEAYMPQSTAKPERVVEKHKPVGAIIAFLGAEFLSRRRDKKLERSIKKQSKELNAKIEDVKVPKREKEPESLASILKRSSYVHEAGKKNDEQLVGATLAEKTTKHKSAETSKQVFYQSSIEKDSKQRNIKNEFASESSIDTHEADQKNKFETKADSSKKDRNKNRFASMQASFMTNIDQSQNVARRESTDKHPTTNQAKILGATDYKRSIETGVGMALIILAIFIVVYTAR